MIFGPLKDVVLKKIRPKKCFFFSSDDFWPFEKCCIEENPPQEMFFLLCWWLDTFEWSHIVYFSQTRCFFFSADDWTPSNEVILCILVKRGVFSSLLMTFGPLKPSRVVWTNRFFLPFVLFYTYNLFRQKILPKSTKLFSLCNPFFSAAQVESFLVRNSLPWFYRCSGRRWSPVKTYQEDNGFFLGHFPGIK